jgi:hypothetical protein
VGNLTVTLDNAGTSTAGLKSARTCLYAVTTTILWVPKTCATWADALQNAGGSVKRSASAGPVLARPEVG